jgi:hypothetical protein
MVQRLADYWGTVSAVEIFVPLAVLSRHIQSLPYDLLMLVTLRDCSLTIARASPNARSLFRRHKPTACGKSPSSLVPSHLQMKSFAAQVLVMRKK